MKIILAVLVVQFALTLAEHDGKREKRSIFIPPFGRPFGRPFGGPFVPGGYFPVGGPRIPIRPFNMTAKDTYDPLNEICCHGNVFPNPKRSDQACCGDNVFDRNKHLCCEGVVKPREQGVTCCGKETYNPDNAICCDSKIIAVTAEEKNVECCGQQKYDTEKSLCCGGLRSETKVLPKNSADDFCCGLEVANSKTQACCGDLTTRGAMIVNSTYHVVPRDENSNKTVCCWGGKLYDPAFQTCCSEQLVDGVNRPCCGDTAIDTENQLCCVGNDGELVAVAGKPSEQGCCGTEAFNVETQMCCGNKKFQRDDESSFCCGDKPYKTKDSFCLLKIDRNGTEIEIIRKTDPKQDAVCGEAPFTMANQKCCPTFDGLKVVEKKSNASILCCGEQTYEWSKATCCVDSKNKQVKLHNSMDYTMDCCGLDLYDTSKQICCGGKISERGESSRCCANSDVYDAETDLCCMNFDKTDLKYAVMAKKGNTTRCCGLKSYDYTKDICCNGQTFPNDGKSQCCQSTVYNSEKEQCCGGNVLPKKDKKMSSCCFYGLGASSGLGFGITVI